MQLARLRAGRGMIALVVGQKNDSVEIGPDGTVAAVGDRAALRLQARAGTYYVLPSPNHLLVMKAAAAEGAVGQAVLLSGEVRSAGTLCDVLSFVGHSGWRGEFVVQEADSSRSIYFDQGYVVGAQSTVHRERLGEVLYRSGVLTREQVTECSDATATGALRFGEAAVKFGLVTRERLFVLMAHQTEEIFYGMMVVGNAMFYFLEGYDETQLSSRHRLSVTALVREGIRRMHEMRYFRARVPSERHIPVRAPGWPAPESDPLGVYATIDGALSVTDICRVLGAGEFEVTRALFQLIQSGRVAMKPPRLPPKAVVEVYNQAIALILRELDAMDEGDAVRAQLATFAAQRTACIELLAEAGPADDGTLDAARVAENVERMAVTPADVEEQLATWLYDYASYALFVARPHLRRMEQARADHRTRLSTRVTALLEPIAPQPVHRPEPNGNKGH